MKGSSPEILLLIRPVENEGKPAHKTNRATRDPHGPQGRLRREPRTRLPRPPPPGPSAAAQLPSAGKFRGTDRDPRGLAAGGGEGEGREKGRATPAGGPAPLPYGTTEAVKRQRNPNHHGKESREPTRESSAGRTGMQERLVREPGLRLPGRGRRTAGAAPAPSSRPRAGGSAAR